MKVLILSCNTGEGHNSAGKAVKEAVERAGHEAVMMDMMILAGPRTSAIVGGRLCKNRKVHSPAVSDAVPGRLRHFVRPEKIPGILRMRADGEKTGAVSGGQRFRCDCDAAPVSGGDA